MDSKKDLKVEIYGKENFIENKCYSEKCRNWSMKNALQKPKIMVT